MSSLELYIDHFGLRTRPFSLAPDPAFLYWSPGHRRAWTMLEYGVLTRAPITLITGDVGVGKTTLLRHLLNQPSSDLTVGLVSNAHGSRGELLQWVLQTFGLPVTAGEGYVLQFGRFQDFLIAEYAAGRRVVLIFDEAQNLSCEALEELRMLTNINSGSDDLVQLVLMGQPELRDRVRAPDMTQFAQRVAAAFHLSAMSTEETGAYIRHRVSVAGGDKTLFSDEAVAAICRSTSGIPRLVNQLSEMAMLYAFSAGRTHVGAGSVQNVLDDGVFFGASTQSPPRLVLSTDMASSAETRGE